MAKLWVTCCDRLQVNFLQFVMYPQNQQKLVPLKNYYPHGSGSWDCDSTGTHVGCCQVSMPFGKNLTGKLIPKSFYLHPRFVILSPIK